MNKSLTSIFKSPDKVPAEDMKSANRAERFFDIFSEYVSKSLMHDFDSVEPHIKHVVQSLEIAKKKTAKVTTPAHVTIHESEKTRLQSQHFKNLKAKLPFFLINWVFSNVCLHLKQGMFFS